MGMSAIRPKPDLLDSDYREALAAYVAYGGEALLARGYELGRKALADGRSIPELVGVHSRALRTLASDDRGPREPGLLIDSAETFLAETLSPFEMTHRGYRDSLIAWRHINEMLEQEVPRVTRRHRALASRSIRSSIRCAV